MQAICDRVIIINKGDIVADDKLSNLQKSNSPGQYVIVQFKEDINSSLLNSMNNISGIENIERGIWKIKISNPENVRKQLLELSLKNNLNIVSLQSENNSLENIFRQLTSAN